MAGDGCMMKHYLSADWGSCVLFPFPESNTLANMRKNQFLRVTEECRSVPARPH